MTINGRNYLGLQNFSSARVNLPSVASPPSGNYAGEMVYDNVAQAIKYADNTLTWVTMSAGSASTFITLTDCPSAYTGASLQAVRVNAGMTGLEFYTNAFIALTDCPNTYAGQSLKAVRVNVGETGLEFYVPSSGGLLPWTEVILTAQALAINNGYIMNNALLVVGTLPVTAAQGSIIRIAGKGAGGWQVAQNAGQSIEYGNKTTTAGVTGSLASTDPNDTIELLCKTADTEFMVLSSVGNITVV